MKCFSVVQKVLQDAYEQIPGDETERDAAVSTALAEMSKTYQRVGDDGGPNFAEPVTRFAYVYSYVPVHAHWIYELINDTKEAKAVFDREKVRIACIGGGPGSDLVGILKFLDERDPPAPGIFCEIVDGCEQWKETWSDIGFTLDLPMGLHTDYVIHRVGDEEVWTHPTKLAKADLLTINFFVSEIVHLGKPAWRYITKILKEAKPGAVLLFNDNNHSSFYETFDALAKKTDWKVLREGNGSRKVYDPEERLDELAHFKKKFGRASKLTGDVAWRALQKSST